MRGFTYEQWQSHKVRALVLGPALALVGLTLSTRWKPAKRTVLAVITAGWVWVIVFSTLMVFAVLVLALRGRAIVDDEFAYAMQASFFLDGRLFGPHLGFLPLDQFNVMGVHDRWTTKYLPGEAILQTLGIPLGLPALAHVLLVPVALFAFHAWVREKHGALVASAAVMSLAVSPMWVLTSATGLSNCGALSSAIVAGGSLQAARRGKRPFAAALGAAIALGFCFASRPQVAVPVGIVLLIDFMVHVVRARDRRALYGLLLGAALGLAPTLIYDWKLCGVPWKLPWFLECRPEHYGFGKIWSEGTAVHDPFGAAFNAVVAAIRLNGFWLGWPVSLIVIYFFKRTRNRFQDLGVFGAIGLAVLVFEAGYYSPGVSDTGAIYHFELLLPLSVMFGLTVRRWLQTSVNWAPFVVAQLLLGTSSFYVEHVARLGRLCSLAYDEFQPILRDLARRDRKALLLTEGRVGEKRAVGWLSEEPFPARNRRADDRVTVYRRPAPHYVDLLRQYYADRDCFYVRRSPQTASPELFRCDERPDLVYRMPVPKDAPRPGGLEALPTSWDLYMEPFCEQRIPPSYDRTHYRSCCALRRATVVGEVDVHNFTCDGR
jgi:hypothetical protein